MHIPVNIPLRLHLLRKSTVWPFSHFQTLPYVDLPPLYLSDTVGFIKDEATVFSCLHEH